MMPPEVQHKARKTHDYFCSKCQQFLQGNGSVITPYKCACGEYKYNFERRMYVHPKEGE